MLKSWHPFPGILRRFTEEVVKDVPKWTSKAEDAILRPSVTVGFFSNIPKVKKNKI